MRLRAVILLVVVALLLSACGFRLRGQTSLPTVMATTCIDEGRDAGLPRSLLAQILARSLRTNGVEVVARCDEASAVLRILDQDRRERIVAAGGDDGGVREYTVRYEVRYALEGSEGEVLLAPTSYVLVRDVLYDESQLLGAAEGEQIAVRQMIEDSAFAILRRLERIVSP